MFTEIALYKNALLSRVESRNLIRVKTTGFFFNTRSYDLKMPLILVILILFLNNLLVVIVYIEVISWVGLYMIVIHE